jgi:hypothetical protein
LVWSHLKYIYCAGNTNYKAVENGDAAGEKPPIRMLSNKAADQLYLLHFMRSKIIRIAIKVRSAMLPDSHKRNATYWCNAHKKINWLQILFYMIELLA